MVVLLVDISQNRISLPVMSRPHERVLVSVALVVLLVASTHLSAQSSASRKALESAAAKGSLAATYALGAAAEAEGDFDKAFTYFRTAAEAGYAGAEFKLGECYENGRGVAVDLAQAEVWYGKAAEQGLAQAVEKLNQLHRDVAPPLAATTSDTPTPNTDTSLATANVEVSKPTSTSAASTGESRQFLPAETAVAAEAPSDESAPNAPSAALQLVAVGIPALVGLVLGFSVWKAVRGMVLRWYRSRQFIVSGRTAMDMMTAEVGLRLQVEWIPFVAGLVVFIGITSLGGILLAGLLGVK